MPSRFIGRSLATLTVGLLATGCIIQLDRDGPYDESMQQFEPLPADLSQLTLSVPAGDLYVETGPDVGIEAILRWRTGDEPPRVVSDEAAGAVTQTWSCRGSRGCAVDLFVTVPDGTNFVDLDLEAGDIDLNDLSGTLRVDLEAGDLRISGHQGDLFIDLEAGDIDASALVADEIDATVEAGSMDLQLIARPGQVMADTSAGDVTIEVPAGAYDLDLGVDVGDIDVDSAIQSDSGASASIRARVDVGSIQIDAN